MIVSDCDSYSSIDNGSLSPENRTVTDGTSRRAASTASDVARGEQTSAICVDRFNAELDAPRLVEFKAITDHLKKRDPRLAQTKLAN